MIEVLVRNFFTHLFIGTTFLLMSSGCVQSLQTIHIEAWDMSLDLALTQASRERGLSGRNSFTSDGLLMAMPDDGPKALWMRNTFIPLTALALDEAGCVVAMRELTPLDERIVHLPDSTRWIVELIEPVKNDLYPPQNCLDVKSLPLPID